MKHHRFFTVLTALLLALALLPCASCGSRSDPGARTTKHRSVTADKATETAPTASSNSETTASPDAVEAPDQTEDDLVETLTELRANGDLFNVLKTWATNNAEHTLMQSADVLNLLLVGVDASQKNADAILLLSLNTAEKKIYLSSVMRDSFTYIDAPSGETAAKINAAYAHGGGECLKQTLQNNYKIRIDRYVSVDHDAFVSAVDILGGVTVAVREYEMNEMNRLAETEDARLGEFGDAVTLNGKQALLYCRIRKCDADGDISRTRRQRQFLTAVIQKLRNISFTQAAEMFKALYGKAETDCSDSELLGYAAQAIAGKWYGYPVDSTVFPLEENRTEHLSGQWVWIVDYPADATALQKRIYGKTNIVLANDRYTACDAVK